MALKNENIINPSWIWIVGNISVVDEDICVKLSTYDEGQKVRSRSEIEFQRGGYRTDTTFHRTYFWFIPQLIPVMLVLGIGFECKHFSLPKYCLLRALGATFITHAIAFVILPLRPSVRPSVCLSICSSV